MKYPPPLLALVLLCLLPAPCRCDGETTVPIYLPYYDERSWSLVRGSIVSKDAHETTYTIFCAPHTPPNCDLALEFPFVFAEGAQTLHFHGTLTSTYTANLYCKLGGTTAATCSGYSSLTDGYVNGLYTGPTEVSWTSTMSGNEVQWGVLTLVNEPPTTNTADAPGSTKPTGHDPFLYDGTLTTGTGGLPAETRPSAASRLDLRYALVASICGALLAGVMI